MEINLRNILSFKWLKKPLLTLVGVRKTYVFPINIREADKKVLDVFLSCQTPEQILSAIKYQQLFIKILEHYGK